MRRFLLCLALWLACLNVAEAQTATAQPMRDSIRWEQVLEAYQSFCDLAADARGGDADAHAKLRKQADGISTLLAQVKGSQMTASQQARFEKMKKRYATVVTLPDLAAAPVTAPVRVIQGQTVVIRDTVFVVREIRQTDTVRVVEQVEKIVEVPVERIVEVPVEAPVEIPPDQAMSRQMPPDQLRTRYLVLAQAVVPDFSFGVMLGTVRKAGLHVRFDSNFRRRTADYACTSAGQASYGQIWTTGHSEKTRMVLTGGALVHPLPWLTAYAGVGYGDRSLYWEDISGNWAQVSDVSRRGVAADVGLVFNLDHFAISAGLSTIGFSRLDASFGLGILF